MQAKREGWAWEGPYLEEGVRSLQKGYRGVSRATWGPAFWFQQNNLASTFSPSPLPNLMHPRLSKAGLSAARDAGFKVHGNDAWGICRATLVTGKQRLSWKPFIPSQTCRLFSLP